MGREEGGGFRMGNTCIPVADSFWYMAKPIQYFKIKKLNKKKNWHIEKKKKKMEGLPRRFSCKESACQAGALGLITGSGRSPGEGNGYPLQYSCLENSIEEKLGGLQSIQSMGSQRVRHSWVTNTFTYLYTIKCWKSEDSHITLILRYPNSVLEVLCICCQIYVKQ